MTQAETFCSCIKKVKKTRKSMKEGNAIAICTKSVLQTRGRTLKKFHCKKHPHLTTQPMKGGQSAQREADVDERIRRSTESRRESVSPTPLPSSDVPPPSSDVPPSIRESVSPAPPSSDVPPSSSDVPPSIRESVSPAPPSSDVPPSIPEPALPNAIPTASGPVAAPTRPPTDADRIAAARKVIDIVESTELPKPIKNARYTEEDVKDDENFVILNPESKFVIVTYWWGRGNTNRNVEHPCAAYEKTTREEIRAYVREYDYIAAMPNGPEKEAAIKTEEEAEYEASVKGNIEKIAENLKQPIETVREMLLRKTPALKFEEMIERFKKDCVKVRCNFLVKEYPFDRPLYQAAINGKPVFVRKAVEACRKLGAGDTDLAVVYIDGDMRANIYPKLFDMDNVDFMARGWNADPRANSSYRDGKVCFDPYIFETSGGIQYFANTAGSLDLLESWKLSNLANPGKADDRVISMAFNVLKYHQALSFIQLPIEYLWLTDNYYFQDPDNTSQAKAIVEHPECLTAEDAAVGASASREPLYYPQLISDVTDCKRVGGSFYEYVFFETADLVETFGPYLDYLKTATVTEKVEPGDRTRRIRPRIVRGTTPLFKVVPYADRYGEHTATAEANLAAAEEAPDTPPITFDIPAILKQLKAGKDVKIGSTPELEEKIATGVLEFIAYVKPGAEKGMDSTYPDAKPEFDLTKPMFLSAKNRVLREVLTMCSPDTVSQVFNESYTFLSRVRCYWLK